MLYSEDGNWLRAFCLYPAIRGRTQLVSRSRIATPTAGWFQRALGVHVIESGGLIMERKMLLSIKCRAEHLAAK